VPIGRRKKVDSPVKREYRERRRGRQDPLEGGEQPGKGTKTIYNLKVFFPRATKSIVTFAMGQRGGLAEALSEELAVELPRAR